MTRTPPTTEPHVERPGPAEFRDPFVRRELQKAAVWFGMALAIAGVIVLGQPLLLIVGGAIFAVFLDGGVRLLGRYLPIPRPWRLGMVLVLGFGFIAWVVWFAGTTISAQFEALRQVVTAQADRLVAFAGTLGLVPKGQSIDLGGQLKFSDTAGAGELLDGLKHIQGLTEKLTAVDVKPKDQPELVVSAAEFLLEGLYAHKRIGRSEERVFTAPEKQHHAEKAVGREEFPMRNRRPYN